jgi:hypothetical protein
LDTEDIAILVDIAEMSCFGVLGEVFRFVAPIGIARDL